MPARSSAVSSTRPAGPTNGAPSTSSRSPGCSPTSTSHADAGPRPKTVWVAGPCSSQRVQPAASRRSRARSGRSGVTRRRLPVSRRSNHGNCPRIAERIRGFGRRCLSIANPRYPPGESLVRVSANQPKESAVDSTVIVLVIVVVVLLLALVAVGMVLAQRRRSERLQEQFGPEYERSVDEAGSRRAAEAQLAEREKRHRKLDIRDLRPEERERFAASWADIQREFVDDPHRAVRDADLLVLDIMRTRGYPVGDDGGDFERRAEDISVEHPDVVQRYREAHRVRTATERGDVDTENQREAVTSYRSLVDALLGTRGHDGA